MTARGAAATLAAAGLIALAGCGDDGPPRLSKAEYERRGDAICTRYLKGIRDLGTPTELTDIAPFIAKALPLLSDTVDRLGGLHPPKELDDEFGRFLEVMRTTRKRAIDLRNAAARGDGDAVQGLLTDAARAGSGTDELARKAGLRACVHG